MRVLILAAAICATPAFAQIVPASDVPATELEREVARIQAFQGVTLGYQAEPEPTPQTEVPAQMAETAPPTTKSHTVVKGDTLFNIARRNAITVDALKEANGLDTSAIALGQTLLIPSVAVKVVEEPTANSALNTHANVLQASQPADRPYAVLPGDTLFSIAGRACVEVKALKASNALAETAIRPGQRLTLPEGHCLK